MDEEVVVDSSSVHDYNRPHQSSSMTPQSIRTAHNTTQNLESFLNNASTCEETGDLADADDHSVSDGRAGASIPDHQGQRDYLPPVIVPSASTLSTKSYHQRSKPGNKSSRQTLSSIGMVAPATLFDSPGGEEDLRSKQDVDSEKAKLLKSHRKSSTSEWQLPSNSVGSCNIFDIPSTEKKNKARPHKPVFLDRPSGQDSTRHRRGEVRIGSDVLDLSFDDLGGSSNKKMGEVKSGGSGSTNRNILDPGTAKKLTEFASKLRLLNTSSKKSDNRHHSSRANESGCLSTSRRSLMSTTMSRNTSMNLPEPDMIVSCVEGRGAAKGEVGIAAFQITNPVLILCQLSDSPTYPRSLSKLMALNPVEIIMPGNTIFASKNDDSGTRHCKLSKEINKFLPHSSIVKVQRKHFEDKKGLSLIQSLRSTEGGSSVEVHYQNKYYALAAAAALIQYLQYTEGIRFHDNSIQVRYESAQRCTTIDPLTAEHIELITSIGDNKSKYSLLGVINKCTTRGGTRLLRSNLFQPSTDKQMTQDRLEAVSELVDNPQLHQALKNSMPRFQDIELILSLCVQQLPDHTNKSPVWLEKKMDKVICLKGILEYLEPLSNLLADVQSKILVEAKNLFTKHAKDCSLLLEMMHLVINKNSYQQRKGSSNLKFARSMVIKENVNPLLDLDRAAMCENIDDLENHTKELEDDHNLHVRLMYSSTKGFYLSVTKEKGKKLDDSLPDVFQRVQKNKNGFTFITEFSSLKDQIIQDYLKEITLISDTILEEVLSEVREYIWFLYQVSETISLLDVITALATVSSGADYTKPEFGDRMCVIGSRHPVLEFIQPEVVANDIIADHDNKMVILTGPNMSGKSTYLRQVVLICIMAQIGCFVPATQATIRIPDRIFSRVSNRDSIQTNSSTFMLEMKEVAHMIEGRSELSLIIIDELGRGTSVEEGSGVCWAVCEELLRGHAFTFLATHFELIPKLAALYPTVTNYHFQMENQTENQQDENFAHKLVKGRRRSGPNDNYGIQLAANTNLDSNVVESARGFLPKVTLTSAVISEREGFAEYSLNLLRSIREMNRLGLPPQQLVSNLRLLQENFLRDTKTMQRDN